MCDSLVKLGRSIRLGLPYNPVKVLGLSEVSFIFPSSKWANICSIWDQYHKTDFDVKLWLDFDALF